MFHILNPYYHDAYLQAQEQERQRRQAHLRRQDLLHQARLRRAAAAQMNPWIVVPRRGGHRESYPSDDEQEKAGEFFVVRKDTRSPATPKSSPRLIPVRYAGVADAEDMKVDMLGKAAPPTPDEEKKEMEVDEQEDGVASGTKEKQERAARQIQGWYRGVMVLRRHLRAIHQIARTLHAEFPRKKSVWRERVQSLTNGLDIVGGKLVPGGKGNKLLLETEEKLTRILLTADGIESGGFAIVRDARKALIREVQGLLEDLETAKQEMTQRHR